MPWNDRSIVLVGLMGAGKSTVGRRLAQILELPFSDSDAEIEAAAGETISEIFENRGETVFRDGERRVLKRLLTGDKMVLATGGGTFMDADTRELISQNAISIWLNASLDMLMERVLRRDNRPLLQKGDPQEIMENLIDERYPVYATADISVDSHNGPHKVTVSRILDALDDFYDSVGA